MWTFHRENNGKGTYAEFVAVPEDNVFPLPDNSSFKDGAACGVPFLTAAQALFNEYVCGIYLLRHGIKDDAGLGTSVLCRWESATQLYFGLSQFRF